MYLCPGMDPRKNGHEASAYSAEFVCPVSSACSHAEGCEHHQERVMSDFFVSSPLAILHSICLAHICCSHLCRKQLHRKAVHGNLVGLAPEEGRCPWSSRSAQQQSLGELGWGGDSVQSRVCHKGKSSSFLMLSLEKLEVKPVTGCWKMQWNVYGLNTVYRMCLK